MKADRLRLRTRLLVQAGLAGLIVALGTGAHAQTATVDGARSKAQVLLGTGAHAQTATGPSATAGEVVVTAEKRSQRLQDVAAPVTALDTEALSQTGQVSLQDYFQQVPGLSLDAEGDGQTQVVIRGIATSPISNPTVGVVIDDVPVGSTTAQGLGNLLIPDIDPADLSQIEVLKGPQGTLYGAASLGGLIKYDLADPSFKAFSGRIAAGVDGTSGGGVGYEVRGGLNIPLADTLALRVSGFSRTTPGYVDNAVGSESDVNEARSQGGHAALLWRPDPRASLKLSLLIQHTHADGFDGVGTTYDQRPLYGDLSQSQPPGSGVYDTTVQLYSATGKLDLGPADLTSITAYGINDYRANPSLPQYGSLATLVTATDTSPGVDGAELVDKYETKKFTQEVRLASRGGGRFDWLVGGFYDHEASPAFQAVQAVDAQTGANAAQIANFDFPTVYEEWAVFGDATLHITDRLSLDGGVRYSQNHQAYHEADVYAPALETPIQLFSVKENDSSTTFQVTPSYKVSPSLLLYARIASGYRPGGVNTDITPGSGTPQSYRADTTLNYEAGAKGQLLDRTLSYDLSIFDVEWSDIQIQLRDPATQLVFFANANDARSTGAEFAFQYTPRPDTRFALNGSYTVAELTQPIPPGGGVGDAGAPLPYSPRFQGSLSADRDLPLPGGWTGTVGGVVGYTGERREAFANDPAELRPLLPSFTRLDLRFSAKRDLWLLSLYANNVTDTRGVLSTTSQGGTTATVANIYNTVYVQPLTVGASVQRRF